MPSILCRFTNSITTHKHVPFVNRKQSIMILNIWISEYIHSFPSSCFDISIAPSELHTFIIVLWFQVISRSTLYRRTVSSGWMMPDKQPSIQVPRSHREGAQGVHWADSLSKHLQGTQPTRPPSSTRNKRTTPPSQTTSGTGNPETPPSLPPGPSWSYLATFFNIKLQISVHQNTPKIIFMKRGLLILRVFLFHNNPEKKICV